MKMTAAVMYEQELPTPLSYNRHFRFADVNLEGPGSCEALVDIRAAGSCRSDLSQVNGLRKRPALCHSETAPRTKDPVENCQPRF